jgi:hypothetical protein
MFKPSQTLLIIKACLVTRVAPFAYLVSLAISALGAGQSVSPVHQEAASWASSLLRVHHLLLSVFVRLALVALAARSALLAYTGECSDVTSSALLHELPAMVIINQGKLVRWKNERSK